MCAYITSTETSWLTLRYDTGGTTSDRMGWDGTGREDMNRIKKEENIGESLEDRGMGGTEQGALSRPFCVSSPHGWMEPEVAK